MMFIQRWTKTTSEEEPDGTTSLHFQGQNLLMLRTLSKRTWNLRLIITVKLKKRRLTAQQPLFQYEQAIIRP